MGTITDSKSFTVTPKFTVLPKNPSEGYERSSVRLDCVAEGDPLPTIQWNNNFVDISQERLVVFLCTYDF